MEIPPASAAAPGLFTSASACIAIEIAWGIAETHPQQLLRSLPSMGYTLNAEVEILY
jgi:hypothetical protein